MKRKSFGFFAIVVCLFGALSVCGFMLPEDKIGKKYWESLDAKTKPVFLMGFRHGTALELTGPETKGGFLVFSAEHFPKVIEKVDAFYKVKDNDHVCIRYAVQVSLMEMSGKPKEEIDKLLKMARSLVYTAY